MNTTTLRLRWRGLVDAIREAREPDDEEPRPNEETVSVHESAHGCVGLYVGQPVKRITLVGRGRHLRGGYASFTATPLTAEETDALYARGPHDEQQSLERFTATHDLWEHLLYSNAGRIADERLGLSPCWASDDRAGIVSLIEQLAKRPSFRSLRGYDRDIKQTLARLDLETEHLVSCHWPWILAVAKDLIARRTLTRDDMLALKPPEPLPPFPWNR